MYGAWRGQGATGAPTTPLGSWQGRVEQKLELSKPPCSLDEGRTARRCRAGSSTVPSPSLHSKPFTVLMAKPPRRDTQGGKVVTEREKDSSSQAEGPGFSCPDMQPSQIVQAPDETGACHWPSAEWRRTQRAEPLSSTTQIPASAQGTSTGYKGVPVKLGPLCTIFGNPLRMRWFPEAMEPIKPIY